MVLLFGSRCCYLYDDHPSIDSHQTSAILSFFLSFFYRLHHTELTQVGWKMLTFSWIFTHVSEAL